MPNNEIAMMKVVKVTDENISIDMNHPLAGKTLSFEIEVVDVEDGPKE